LQACLSLLAIFAGVPEPPSISGARSGEWSKAVSITWSTLSYSPIFNYRLLYRKKEVTLLEGVERGKHSRGKGDRIANRVAKQVAMF
jgi:hypothetical protein